MRCYARLAGIWLSTLVLASSPPALALANRVFVSARSGNNLNSCDNVNTPCQTFAGAVLQLNPGGEAIVLDSGGYGPVTITQSLTIEAPPGIIAFVHPPSGDAITVTAGSGTVVLRGLVLNGGSGVGIKVNAAGVVHVENCVISGFSQAGISYGAVSSNFYVKDTISRQNSNGIAVFGGRGSIDHSRFEGNVGSGVLVDGGDVTVRDSVSAGNGAHGFSSFTGGAENSVLNVDHCVSTNNTNSGVTGNRTGSGFVIARVSNSSISDNFGAGLDNASGDATFESLGNNMVRGNLGGQTNNTITTVLGQ